MKVYASLGGRTPNILVYARHFRKRKALLTSLFLRKAEVGSLAVRKIGGGVRESKVCDERKKEKSKEKAGGGGALGMRRKAVMESKVACGVLLSTTGQVFKKVVAVETNQVTDQVTVWLLEAKNDEDSGR